MGWTTPATLVTGDVIQASWANTHVRDNSRYLKGLDGAVAIQDDINVTGGITTTDDVDIAGGLTLDGPVGVGTDSPQAIFHIVETNSGFSIARLSNNANGSNLKNWQIVIEADGDLSFVSANDAWSAAIATVLTLTNAGGIVASGAGLTNLNASNLASGTVPDGRLSSNVAFSGENISQFTNNSGYLTASTDNTDTTKPIYGTEQSIANGGTYTICSSGEGGLFALRDDQGNFALLYLFTGPLQSEIADPFNVFSFVAGTASSWNLYITGGNITIQNNRGSTRTISIARLAGG